ncbi:MAG: hypothetical protein KAR42_17605 [candidate division Zixibacteria bacterium]|nr:hypothetical protein [candidate division Zixibacteria bacterium]
MGRLGKKFKLGLGGGNDSTQLQLDIDALSIAIEASSALQRLMRNNDWVHVSNLFLEMQNDALTKGKAANPEDDAKRLMAMAELNAIDIFNIKIRNVLMKGDDALKRLPGLRDKLNSLEPKTG